MRRATQIRKDILTFLGSVVDGLTAGYALAHTMNRQMVRAMYGPRYPLREINRTLTRLQYAGYIRIDHDAIELTPEGAARARRYRLEDLVLEKPEQWDNIWRVIIWDIPEVAREKRDIVRLTLRKLGLVRIQRSIWVTPYPCQHQIQSLRQQLDLPTGLLYMEATVIEGDSRLRRWFHLADTEIE